MVLDLTEQQKDVLSTIAKTKDAYGSELARILNKTQMAVYKNMQPLIEAKLLTSELQREGGKRIFKLTDKGAYYAVSQCKLSYLDIVENHPYLETVEGAKESWAVLDGLGLAQFLMFEIADLSVKKDLFDSEGGWLLDVEKYGSAAMRYMHYFSAIFREATFKLVEAQRLDDLKAKKTWMLLAVKYHVQPKEVEQIIVQARR